MNSVIKTCRCKAEYTQQTWLFLPRIGPMDDGVDLLELRNCRCGSTLAIVIGPSVTGSVTYKFRCVCGPRAVNELAARLRSANITAQAGTEHVYGIVPASTKDWAVRLINEAAGCTLAKAADMELVKS